MSPRRAVAIVLLLGSGMLAGAQLGKIAPLIPWYTAERGMSLVGAGWLTAAIGAFVALAALPAGMLIERVGGRKSFAAASLLLALGGVLLALSSAQAAVVGARLVEGLGYLALVIAAPALISSISPQPWRPAALAIWGGFVPVGFACADFLSGLLLPERPQAFLLTLSVAFAALAAPAAALAFRVTDASDVRCAIGSAPRSGGALNGAVWMITLAFGAYVVASIGFFTFMPTFLAGAGSLLPVGAGVVALSVPVGNALAGLLLRREGGSSSPVLAACGFAASAAAGLVAFSSGDPTLAALAALAVAMSGGVTASALFAAVPSAVSPGGSVATAIGLVAQAGGLGTLFGPPLAGWVVEALGWPGLGGFIALVSLLGAGSLVPLMLRRSARISA